MYYVSKNKLSRFNSDIERDHDNDIMQITTGGGVTVEYIHSR